MRCGIYSLARLVENSLKVNSVRGEVFIFIGKSGNQIRLLQWDRDGNALYIKGLEAGTFERPADAKLQLSLQELMLILQGIKLKSGQFIVRLQENFIGAKRLNFSRPAHLTQIQGV